MNAISTGWIQLCWLEDIPVMRARTIPGFTEEIAIFRCGDDQVFALANRCPHKQGPLSEGIIHGHAVTCPLHGWVIDLKKGEAVEPDIGCVPHIPVRIIGGMIWIAP